MGGGELQALSTTTVAWIAEATETAGILVP